VPREPTGGAGNDEDLLCPLVVSTSPGYIFADQTMSKTSLGYTYWQDGDMWLGYLDDYPDYMTQGETIDELKDNLIDIYKELVGGAIPAVRHHADLAVA
jgi:predicted RNase H-like HicB family nuclease